MQNFAAIDFETANHNRSSVCSVGIVVVREGEVVDEFYSLIKPEPDYYNYHNTLIHGLSKADTEDAEVFPYVWERVSPLIEGLDLVAHNSVFDEGCLKEVFRVYQMEYPDYRFHCTCRTARMELRGVLEHFNLDKVAAYYGYDMTQHHHAMDDARACAHIALRLL